MILLAGQVGRNPLFDAIDRFPLDLPVSGESTLFDSWIEQLDGLSRALNVDRLTVRVAVDRAGRLPSHGYERRAGRLAIEVVRDPGEYRGTAGVVRDLTRDYDPGDWVLIAAANQILREPLDLIVGELQSLGESVSIVPSAGSEIAGIFLLRCQRLGSVPEIGFVDLKEQAIPAARGHPTLRVARRPAGSTVPVRTLPEYIRALRAIHGEAAARDQPAGADEDPFAETWQPVFSIVEAGASVAPGVILQDCVVLRGATVGPGALIVRSVVCEHARVGPTARVVDAIITRPA